jgi:hypothetical protein
VNVKRVEQSILIGSTLIACWLGMQAVHEAGHVVGALLTGGEVRQVVLNPLTISRTELARNPHPLIVVWAGPLIGVTFPVAVWGGCEALRMTGAFVLRFFAGFCFVANGAYIAGGSFGAIGDAGEMLKHGSAMWHLWLFGAITIPLAIWLWHGQGRNFGLGPANGEIDRRVTYVTLAIAIALFIVGLSMGRD